MRRSKNDAESFPSIFLDETNDSKTSNDNNDDDTNSKTSTDNNNDNIRGNSTNSNEPPRVLMTDARSSRTATWLEFQTQRDAGNNIQRTKQRKTLFSFDTDRWESWFATFSYQRQKNCNFFLQHLIPFWRQFLSKKPKPILIQVFLTNSRLETYFPSKVKLTFLQLRRRVKMAIKVVFAIRSKWVETKH